MKILIIDDDKAMTELVELLLEPTSIEITKTHSAQEGLILAKEESIEMIILDLMMPEIDGWKICEAIREFSSVPILIISALDSPNLIAKALDSGADDYLVKPVTRSMLIAHVNKLIRRNNKSGVLSPTMIYD